MSGKQSTTNNSKGSGRAPGRPARARPEILLALREEVRHRSLAAAPAPTAASSATMAPSAQGPYTKSIGVSNKYPIQPTARGRTRRISKSSGSSSKQASQSSRGSMITPPQASLQSVPRQMLPMEDNSNMMNLLAQPATGAVAGMQAGGQLDMSDGPAFSSGPSMPNMTQLVNMGQIPAYNLQTSTCPLGTGQWDANMDSHGIQPQQSQLAASSQYWSNDVHLQNAYLHDAQQQIFFQQPIAQQPVFNDNQFSFQANNNAMFFNNQANASMAMQMNLMGVPQTGIQQQQAFNMGTQQQKMPFSFNTPTAIHSQLPTSQPQTTPQYTFTDPFSKSPLFPNIGPPQTSQTMPMDNNSSSSDTSNLLYLFDDVDIDQLLAEICQNNMFNNMSIDINMANNATGANQGNVSMPMDIPMTTTMLTENVPASSEIPHQMPTEVIENSVDLMASDIPNATAMEQTQMEQPMEIPMTTGPIENITITSNVDITATNANTSIGTGTITTIDPSKIMLTTPISMSDLSATFPSMNYKPQLNTTNPNSSLYQFTTDASNNQTPTFSLQGLDDIPGYLEFEQQMVNFVWNPALGEQETAVNNKADKTIGNEQPQPQK